MIALGGPPPVTVSLATTRGLTPIEATVDAVTYRGVRGVRVMPIARGDSTFGALVVIDSLDFTSGTIELAVAGTVATGADTSMRGFAGVTFHTADDGARFEDFFLRATNGRAEDQLRRNHTLQYQSRPDHPWFALRKATPGRYEAYADVEAGAWTRLRLVVDGRRASLFVNGARQPALIVNDLALGETHGRIGLWVGPGTVAYFSRLVVSRRGPSDPSGEAR
jgi:hypothetical protein